MMGGVSQTAPMAGEERGAGEEFPGAEIAPAVRAQAARAQRWVFVVMVIMIILPVAVWWGLLS